jgi:integrase
LVNLEDIDEIAVGEFIDWMKGRGLRPNRFNRTLAVCKRVWHYLLPGKPNPFAEQRREPLDTQSREPFTPAELARIFERAAGELRALLALGRYAGLRLGDAATLRWSEVDFTSGDLVRVPSKTKNRCGRAVIVPLHPELRAELLSLPQPKDAAGFVLPATAERYNRDRRVVSLHLSRFFRDTCGIATGQAARGGGLRPIKTKDFHSLRHTFASDVAAAGASTAALESLLGHSSPALQRVYVHVGREELRRVVGAGQRPALPAHEPERAALVDLATRGTLDQVRAALAAAGIQEAAGQPPPGRRPASREIIRDVIRGVIREVIRDVIREVIREAIRGDQAALTSSASVLASMRPPERRTAASREAAPWWASSDDAPC